MSWLKSSIAIVATTLLATAILVTQSVVALAVDPFPSRPIRIIANSAPGALLDATVRAVAERMADDLGRAIIIDNRTGANGLIGIRYVKSQPADGYTILATANTIAQLPALTREPGYDLVRDFVGVGMMNQAPLIMVGTVNQWDKTLAELISNAKANPGKLIYATAGVGTSTHMAATLLLYQAGLKVLHVPYKGNAAAMPDVLSGRVNFIFDGGNSAGPHVRDGRLRAFGISSPKRSAAFPEIPTLAEQGLPDYSFFVYLGLVAPAATPNDVVQRLAKALRFALASDSVRDRFRRDGADAGNTTSESFTEYLRQDMLRTIKVAAEMGLAKE